MIELTLQFTDEQATGLLPAIQAEAAMLAQNPDVLRRLPGGLTAEEVATWPIKRQAKLVIYSTLMFLRQRHDRRLAEIEHGEAAAEAALTTSAFEVE